MEEHDKTDGWNDGWHTSASTGDSLNTLRDSVLGAAKATIASATHRDPGDETKAEPRADADGWSDGRHASARPLESLGALRDSAVKATTTREGWWKIARGTGKVAAATAVVGFEVVRNLLHADNLHDEVEEQVDSEDGWRHGFEGTGYYHNGFRIDDVDEGY
ncbi:hypothetical protein [Vreelandella zhaodongensis]|uniref:hypothetical protein n=1 Tax=Vreelandella zhaodongensis TaxID=1176240 RepID=UPI003EBE2FE1